MLALGAVLEGRTPYRIVDGNVEPHPLDTLTGLTLTAMVAEKAAWGVALSGFVPATMLPPRSQPSPRA